jgi:mRNA-degrading endonuclease toxin of MazEF toxin-antitoxin module
VLLPAKDSGLPRASVANVTQFVTIDLDYLEERAGKIPSRILARVEAGVRLVLDL